MPGFIVSGVGGSRSRSVSNTKPVYTYTWEINSLFEDPSNTTSILAKEATPPTFTISKENVDGSSLVYKYAGMVVWEDIRITFYDTVSSSDSGAPSYTPQQLASMGLPSGQPSPGQLKTSTVLKNWREKVWSSSTGLKSPADYKKDSVISVYTLDWVDSLKSIWTLHGSWPSVVKEGDLTYTSTDIKVIEVTISYDWAELDESPNNSR